MPEIDANELRRLRRLESRLVKANDKAKKETAEKRNLERRVRATDEEITSLSSQVTELVEENRRLAEQLDRVSADVEPLRTASEEERQDAEAARAEAREATESRDRIAEASQALEAERDRLRARLETAEAQLEEEGQITILPAEEVTQIVAKLVNDLRSSLTGLSVREGEVKLKVAFGGAGERAGFVIPTFESGPEIKDALNELTLRFE